MEVIIEIHAKIDNEYPTIPLIKYEATETFENNQLTTIIDPINFINENLKQLRTNEAFIDFILIPNKAKRSEGFKVEVTLEELIKIFTLNAQPEFKSFLSFYFKGIFKDLLMSALTSQKYTLTVTESKEV